MRKRLFGLAAIVSGVLAVGALLGWYRSRSHLDLLKIGRTALYAKDGKLAIQHPSLAFGSGPWLQWETVPYDMSNDPMPIEFRGPTFGYNTIPLKNGTTRTVVFPFWVAGIVFSVLPGVWVKRRMWAGKMRPEAENQSAVALKSTQLAKN
jgi:hypothetical protein